MDGSFNNWQTSVRNQINFYQSINRGGRRVDDEWEWYLRSEGRLERLRRLTPRLFRAARALSGRTAPRIWSVDWFVENAKSLWWARQLLADGLSSMLFDAHLILKCTDPSRYLFPRAEHKDLLEIKNVRGFSVDGYPSRYGHDQLLTCDVELLGQNAPARLQLISPMLTINLINRYRQYFVQRGSVSFVPLEGDIVFDCGACIGEISTLFAGLVGPNGRVHTFDPTPLHTKFIKLHSELNPHLEQVFKINEVAVDQVSRARLDVEVRRMTVNPGKIEADEFSTTSLDDYARVEDVTHVSYIKMDIEGYEARALAGAKNVISTMRPKLAVCAYHNPEDLWELPRIIKDLNPNYKLYFGHHTSLSNESVFYAC